MLKVKRLKGVLGLCALIFTLSACKSKSSQTEDILGETRYRDEINNLVSIPTRKYFTDSSYLTYGYKTDLKNGFRLKCQVYFDSGFTDTMKSLLLLKRKSEIKTIAEVNYGLPHKNLGYVGADFDSSFVLIHSFGSGNPHYMELIEKASGNEIIHGIWCDADVESQMLLFVTNDSSSLEKLLLYDVTSKSILVPMGYEQSKCIQHAIGGLWNCVRIDSVTKNEVILKIGSIEDEVVIKVNR